MNEYQEKMDEFIRATHKEHLDDRVWKAWRQRTGVHPLLQSKGSQAYRGTESLFGFEERDEGGSEISNDKLVYCASLPCIHLLCKLIKRTGMLMQA